MEGSNSTHGKTDGAQLGPTGTVGKKKAIFRATTGKKLIG
jgi:hypothetical protein